MNKPKITVTEVVSASVGQVWGSWADFGSIYQFHHDVRSTTILTPFDRGVGAERLCRLMDQKNEIVERIIELEHERLLAVEFVRTTLPIQAARAEFSFKPLGPARTGVELRFWFEMQGIIGRLLEPMARMRMRAGFARLLAGNKQFVERGVA